MFVRDEDHDLQAEDAAMASALSSKEKVNINEKKEIYEGQKAAEATLQATIRITEQGGMQYKFENGYTLSIGCGVGHYSSNNHCMGEGASYEPCSEVEVAVRNRAGGFVALPMDVSGWVDAKNIPLLFTAVAHKDWAAVAEFCGEEYQPHERDDAPFSDVPLG